MAKKNAGTGNPNRIILVDEKGNLMEVVPSGKNKGDGILNLADNSLMSLVNDKTLKVDLLENAKNIAPRHNVPGTGDQIFVRRLKFDN
jgi:hypothetical protein